MNIACESGLCSPITRCCLTGVRTSHRQQTHTARGPQEHATLNPYRPIRTGYIMSHTNPQDLDSRKRLLDQIVTIDDLTEQRIVTLRALTYSNIHLPWLDVRF